MAKAKQQKPAVTAVQDENRINALETALKNIEKNFGKGAVMRMGDKAFSDIDVISTTSLGIDRALGIGGIPRGRVTEIYGPESSGKTTVALHVIAEAQRNGGFAAFIDAEHAFDPVYAKNLGVDLDNLIISQPDNGEQALEILEELVRSGSLDVVVVDSVAALVPRAEIDGEMGDSHVGLHARLMSQALRKLTGVIKKSNTAAIFINQLREKVGVLYGNPEVTTGGRALKFYSTIRMDIRRIDSLKKGTEIIGNRTRVKVVKNKLAPPFKTAEFDILYGEGISAEGDLLDIAVEEGIIKKSGSWFSYEDQRLGQGRDKVRLFLQENPEINEEIKQKVKDAITPGAVEETQEDVEEETDEFDDFDLGKIEL